MPTVDPGKRWPAHELRQHALPNGPFDLQAFVTEGIYLLRAEDGIGICSLITPDARETTSVVFVFETGEIWSIDTTLLAYSSNDLRPVNTVVIPVLCVPKVTPLAPISPSASARARANCCATATAYVTSASSLIVPIPKAAAASI
jgi:hypothetical protein